MNRAIYGLCLLALLASNGLAQNFTSGAVYPGYSDMPIYRQSVTVTNTPAEGDQLNVNGTLWTWTTNAPSANEALITTNSNSALATNLYAALTSSAPAQATATLSATNKVLLTGAADVALAVVGSNDWALVTAESTNTYDGVVSIALDASDKWIELDNTSTNRIWYTFGAGNTNSLLLFNAPSLESVADTGGNNYRLILQLRSAKTLYLLGENVNSNKVAYTKESNRAQ